MANIWHNISSTKSAGIHCVRLLTIKGVVVSVVDFSTVGGEGREEVIEVCLVDTVTGVVTLLVHTGIV